MKMTQVRVRAQAHGGKYLGPAVSKAPPILTVLIDGKQVGPTFTFPTLSSGTVVRDYTIGVSPHTIFVQPEVNPNQYYPSPGTYYLLAADEGEADLIVPLELAVPTAVEFRVTAFTSNNEDHPVYGSSTMTVIPGGDYTQLQPGLVVPIYGLRVFDVFAAYDPKRHIVNVAAKVEMMCGCPISKQPRTTPVPAGTEPYWPSSEFQITALFLDPRWPFPPLFGSATLSASEETASLFSGTASLPSGNYMVVVSATQPGFSNTGAAQAHVSVP